MFDCAAEHGAKGIPDGAHVLDARNGERARGILQLTRPDREPVIAPEARTEEREILRQTPVGIHHPRGVDTEPNPKSVVRPYPPGLESAASSERTGSSVARFDSTMS